jgi:hypothetical protein
VGALTVATLVAVFAAPGAVAAVATIELSATVGPPGTAVIVTGTGFQPGEIVDVFLDERDVTAVAAGNQGRVVDARVELPGGALPGTHWFTVLGRHSGRSAQASFDVTPATWTSWPLLGGDPGRTGVRQEHEREGQHGDEHCRDHDGAAGQKAAKSAHRRRARHSAIASAAADATPR